MPKNDRLKKVEQALEPEKKSLLFLSQDEDNPRLYHSNPHPASWREGEPADVVYTQEQVDELSKGEEYEYLVIFTHNSEAEDGETGA